MIKDILKGEKLYNVIGEGRSKKLISKSITSGAVSMEELGKAYKKAVALGAQGRLEVVSDGPGVVTGASYQEEEGSRGLFVLHCTDLR